MVALVVRGQCSTHGASPSCGVLDRRQDCQDTQSPSPKMIPYRLDIREENFISVLTSILRGTERTPTPHPGVGYLVPIEAPVPQDKGKGKEKEINVMDEGKADQERSLSLTISEYAMAFHQGEDSAFVYNWIDDKHGDSWSDLDIKETECQGRLSSHQY
jgi:hypothetical protein